MVFGEELSLSVFGGDSVSVVEVAILLNGEVGYPQALIIYKTSRQDWMYPGRCGSSRITDP